MWQIRKRSNLFRRELPDTNDGGVRRRCKTHGGFPLCSTDSSKTPVGNVSQMAGSRSDPKTIAYKDRGIRGKCIKHVGYPHCSKDKTPSRIRTEASGGNVVDTAAIHSVSKRRALHNNCPLHGRRYPREMYTFAQT